MAYPSVITGKKSNTSVTLADQKHVNQAAQDNAIVVNVADSTGARIELSDAGAIAAGENISRNAFDFAGRALESLNSVVDGAARQAESIAKASLQTANIRSQLPDETINAENSELFRVGIIAAALVAGAYFMFGKG